jgi:hypothetical protein
MFSACDAAGDNGEIRLIRHEKFYKIKRRDARGKTFGCGEKIFNMEAVRKAERIQGRVGKILIRLKPAASRAKLRP